MFMQHTFSTVDVDVVITSTLRISGRSTKRHNYRSVNKEGFFAFDHSGMADTHNVGDHDKIYVFEDGEELQVHEAPSGETLSEGVTSDLSVGLSDEQLDAELEKSREIIDLMEKRKKREEKTLNLVQLQAQIKTGMAEERLVPFWALSVFLHSIPKRCYLP